MEPLCLFYFEPFDDRWLPGDRYPRAVARWLLRRNPVSGHRHLVRQLRLGLRRAGIEYRFNQYAKADRHPDQPLGVLGKDVLLDRWHPRNPGVFGPCLLDHPKDRPDLLERFNVRACLVPSEWVRAMFAPCFGEKVVVWPIGIDLDRWADFSHSAKSVDFLIYEKFIWDKSQKLQTMLPPILSELSARGFSYTVLHCGQYTHEEYRQRLKESRRMIFLCEHETQGQACQQALACNVPVFAWDQGWWLDPKARRYESKPVPASSVPYFSASCGLKFRDLAEFKRLLPEFWESAYSPRAYVAEHLELVQSARRYAELVRSAAQPLS